MDAKPRTTKLKLAEGSLGIKVRSTMPLQTPEEMLEQARRNGATVYDPKTPDSTAPQPKK